MYLTVDNRRRVPVARPAPMFERCSDQHACFAFQRNNTRFFFMNFKRAFYADFFDRPFDGRRR